MLTYESKNGCLGFLGRWVEHDMDLEQAHRLLDQLDPSQLDAVGHLLEVMVDPIARAAAAAPPDDEPVTDEDRRRFHEGQALFAKRSGKGIPMQDVLAESGFRPEDFR